MSSLIFYIYSMFLYPLAYCLVQAVSPLIGGKLRQMVLDKNTHYTVVNKALSSRPIWIHAASGEIEYARSVIREIKKNTAKQIIVTYSSPSAKKILAQLEVDVWCALPWDFASNMNSFLQKWNPEILLVARTDVWPQMALSTKKFGIPAYLFSATFAENSSRLRGLSGQLNKFALNQLNKIYCVSNDDLENLNLLNLNTPACVLGDTRFDQVLHRLGNPKKLKPLHSEKYKYYVLGSTWPEDEQALFPHLDILKNKGVKIIIAPHEATTKHLNEIQSELSRFKLSFCLYSQTENWHEQDVLIIDQVGILAEVYTWGFAAFVGGSFKKQIHSVMEPLAAGLPVLVGPFHRNNREAIEYQKYSYNGLSFVSNVKDETEIQNYFESIVKIASKETQQQILSKVKSNQGSTEKLLHEIKI